MLFVARVSLFASGISDNKFVSKLNDRYNIDVITTLKDRSLSYTFISDHEYVYATSKSLCFLNLLTSEKKQISIPSVMLEKRILSIKNLDYDHVNNYLYMNFIIDGNKDIHSFLYRYSLKNSKWEELKELYDNVYKFKSHNSSLILTTMKDSYYYLYNISTGSMDNLKIEKQNGRFLNHVLSFNKSTNDLLSKFIFDDDREMYCLYNLDSEDIRFFDASCTKRKISFEDYALYDNFFIALNKVYQYTSDIYMYSFATSSYKEILTDLPFSIYSLKKYNQDKVVFLAVNERTDNMFLCTKKIVEEGD